LFLKRGRRAANVLLSAVVFSTTISVTAWFLVASGLLSRVQFLAYLPVYLGASLGPLFYFYTKTLLNPDYKPRIYLVVALVLLPELARYMELYFAGVDPARLANALHEGATITLRRSRLVPPYILTLYLLMFLFLARRQIRRSETTHNNAFSDGASSHLAWLKTLNASLFLFSAVVVVFLLNLLVTLKWVAYLVYAETLIRCSIIQVVAIAAFFLPEAFSQNVAELVNNHRRTPLDDFTATRYLIRLRAYMETEKPYRIEDLRLAGVADELSIPAHVLSQVVNDHLQTNFSDFVNRYRIEEARRQLEDANNDQFTLLAIAREAGFNSKTSFYRAFKKHVGMSPPEYRYRLKETGRVASD
jgi:AraC-like DNA-binding protein